MNRLPSSGSFSNLYPNVSGDSQYEDIHDDDQISREVMSDGDDEEGDEDEGDNDDEYRNFLTGLFSDELEEDDGEEEYSPDQNETFDDDDYDVGVYTLIEWLYQVLFIFNFYLNHIVLRH